MDQVRRSWRFGTRVDVLPNELVDVILDYVTQRDLKNLRLAGRWHLADLASPKLFTTAYIAARRGVIDVLAGLAGHPVLRYHVRTFVFDSSYLDPEIHGDLSGDDWSDAVEVVHEDKALALAFAHQEYIQTRELISALDDAFASFPNIQKVVYADMARTACLPGDTLGSAASLPESNHPLLQRLLSGKFRKGLSECCFVRSCGKKHLNFHRRQYKGLVDLWYFMGQLDSLSELSLGSNALAPNTAGIPYFFLDKDTWGFDQLLHRVRRLRKLDITLCFPSLERDSSRPNVGLSTENRKLDYRGLKKLLECAERLEELYLSGEVDVATLSLERFWPNRTLKSLRILHLRTTAASYEKLSELIWCNRHNLRHLQLDDFNLTTKGWPSISEFVQEHAPNLNVVYGYTWFNSVTRSITWCPEDKSASTNLFHSGVVANGVEEEDDPEDGSYSDGSDFEKTTPQWPGWGRKRAHQPEEKVKTLKVESDAESLEFDSDDSSPPYERDDRAWDSKDWIVSKR